MAQIVELPLCPVRHVVVYADRAEVTREISLKDVEAGENEVTLNNISKVIDKDSVRIDGTGAASIMEVSFQDIPVTEEQDNQSELKEEVHQLEEELIELDKKFNISTKRKERLDDQTDLLDKYTDTLVSSGKGAGPVELVNKDTIDNVFSFMDTFEKESMELMTKKTDNEEERKKLSKRREEVKNRLSNLKPKIRTDENAVIKQTVIGIMLAVKERGDITLLVSYVVTNAHWTPKYDLRVNSADRTMQVSYFGMIDQYTGEDWNDAKISLSTASPNVGGTPPDLSTLRLNLVHFNDSAQRERYYRRNFGNRSNDDDYDRLRALPVAPPGGSFDNSAFGGGGGKLSSAPMTNPQAQVTEGLASSVFEIVASASIPSDNSSHKVSIATIDLKPTFEYETVPKLSQHAFLKAKVKNESHYPLLAGPANVFLDQSFVTKTSLKSVSPNEEFSCSLGADPSVKVVYKPVSRVRGESGLINVSVNFNYTQITEITNTRNEPTTVLFTDQIPLSRDEKLKVTLIEPNIIKGKPGQPPPNPNLTPVNHVTWSLDFKPSETKKLLIRYSVEYPKNKRIEVRHSVSYRPVIVMHGVLAGASDMDSFVNMIKTAHPGTEVTDISDYNDANSLVNMNEQVKGVYSKMKPVMDAAEDGVNLVCYSQGGLVCRGVLEKYGHNVHTFISLSSPQAGQFGDTDYLNFLFPTFTRDNIYLFFYTDAGQEISVGNYWNDPFHHSEYLSKNKFLPSITNNAPQEYKDNILKLEQVVFIGGPDDGVITPWQSSHFGFYKENSASEIITMTEQEYYTNDMLGLQTLNNAGKIKVYEIPGVQHTHWHTNQSVFDDAIIQWLD